MSGKMKTTVGNSALSTEPRRTFLGFDDAGRNAILTVLQMADCQRNLIQKRRQISLGERKNHVVVCWSLGC